MPNGEGFAEVKLSCAVPAVIVKFTLAVSVVPKDTGEDPESVTVPDPKFTVLVFKLSDATWLAVKLYVEQEKDPFVTVNPVLPASNALPRLHPQSTPFTVTALDSATPFVVNVNPVVEPDSVIAPVYVRVNPVAGSVTLPWMPTIAVDPASVTFPDAGPAMVSDFILMPPVTASTVAV